jgi:outer membrane receptor protein involved in Fe transport
VFEYVDAEGNLKQNYWKPKDNGGANPYWTINRNLKEDVSNRVIGYTSLTYSINDNVDLMVRSSIDNFTFFRETRDYNDSYIIADNGNYGTSNRSTMEWNNDFLLTFNEEFGDLNLNLNIGGNNRIERVKNFGTNNGGLNAPNIFAVSNAQRLTSSQGISRKNVNSIYAFTNIGYKKAVFLDLTYRSDWSSTLPIDNNKYDYVSTGLSGIISDMIEFPKVVNYFKVRASYAEVGNETAPFQLTRNARLESGGLISLETTSPANDLRPEKTKSFEAGFETTLFNQRFNLDFTYYKSNSVDQLFKKSVPQASGITTKFINGADIQNSGIEAVANFTVIKS